MPPSLLWSLPRSCWSRPRGWGPQTGTWRQQSTCSQWQRSWVGWVVEMITNGQWLDAVHWEAWAPKIFALKDVTLKNIAARQPGSSRHLSVSCSAQGANISSISTSHCRSCHLKDWPSATNNYKSNPGTITQETSVVPANLTHEHTNTCIMVTHFRNACYRTSYFPPHLLIPLFSFSMDLTIGDRVFYTCSNAVLLPARAVETAVHLEYYQDADILTVCTLHPTLLHCPPRPAIRARILCSILISVLSAWPTNGSRKKGEGGAARGSPWIWQTLQPGPCEWAPTPLAIPY